MSEAKWAEAAAFPKSIAKHPFPISRNRISLDNLTWAGAASGCPSGVHRVTVSFIVLWPCLQSCMLILQPLLGTKRRCGSCQSWFSRACAHCGPFMFGQSRCTVTSGYEWENFILLLNCCEWQHCSWTLGSQAPLCCVNLTHQQNAVQWHIKGQYLKTNKQTKISSREDTETAASALFYKIVVSSLGLRKCALD